MLPLVRTAVFPEKELEERANVQGVWFEEDYLRIYPFHELACDTIGFTLFARNSRCWAGRLL